MLILKIITFVDKNMFPVFSDKRIALDDIPSMEYNIIMWEVEYTDG